jgi:hypothetical protein
MSKQRRAHQHSKATTRKRKKKPVMKPWAREAAAHRQKLARRAAREKAKELTPEEQAELEELERKRAEARPIDSRKTRKQPCGQWKLPLRPLEETDGITNAILTREYDRKNVEATGSPRRKRTRSPQLKQANGLKVLGTTAAYHPRKRLAALRRWDPTTERGQRFRKEASEHWKKRGKTPTRTACDGVRKAEADEMKRLSRLQADVMMATLNESGDLDKAMSAALASDARRQAIDLLAKINARNAAFMRDDPRAASPRARA